MFLIFKNQREKMDVPENFENCLWSAKGYTFLGKKVQFGSVAKIIATTDEDLVEIVGYPKGSFNYDIQFEHFLDFDKIMLQLSRMKTEKVTKYLQSNPQIVIQHLIESEVIKYLNQEIEKLTESLQITEKVLLETKQERDSILKEIGKKIRAD